MSENVYEADFSFKMRVRQGEGSETEQFPENPSDILKECVDQMNKMPTFETTKFPLSHGANRKNNNNGNDDVNQNPNDGNENTSGSGSGAGGGAGAGAGAGDGDGDKNHKAAKENVDGGEGNRKKQIKGKKSKRQEDEEEEGTITNAPTSERNEYVEIASSAVSKAYELSMLKTVVEKGPALIEKVADTASSGMHSGEIAAGQKVKDEITDKSIERMNQAADFMQKGQETLLTGVTTFTAEVGKEVQLGRTVNEELFKELKEEIKEKKEELKEMKEEMKEMKEDAKKKDEEIKELWKEKVNVKKRDEKK